MGATEDVAAGLSASADNAMSCVLEKHRARGVPLKAAIRVSSAAEEVQRFAEEIHADLIVVGTHVRRGLARALLGSVAEGIVRTATRPVVVVPSPTTR
jgi:nucleotide-binding universal stress UspA family protein